MAAYLPRYEATCEPPRLLPNRPKRLPRLPAPDGAAGRRRARRDQEAVPRQPARGAHSAQGGRARGSVPRAARGRRPRHHDDRLRRPRLGTRRARDRARDPRRSRRHLPGRAPRRRLARARRLRRSRTPDGYEVIDTKLARHAKPAARASALLLHRADRADPGARARRDARRHRDSARRETFRPQDFAAYYRRLRGSASSTRSTSAPDIYPYPVDFCGLCDFLSLCKERWDARRPPHARRRRLAASGRAARSGRDRHARWRSRADHRDQDPEHARLDARRAPAAGSAPAPPPRDRRAQSRVPRPSRTTAGSTSSPSRRPGDIWLDFEGDPWFDPAHGLEYLTGWIELDDAGEPRLPRPLGAGPRRPRSAAFEQLRRPRRRAPPPLPRDARLPLRGLRAHRPHAAHGRARHARGRDRRPAARRGARRPLPRHEAGAARVRPVVLDQGGRGALRVRAHRRRRRRRASRSRTSSAGSRSGSSRSSTGSATTTEEDCVSLYELHRWLLGLRPDELPVAAAAGAARAHRGGRGARRGARPRARRAARRGGGGRSATGCSRHLLDYHRREARPQWWAYFHNLGLDEEELIDDGETIGGLELVGEPVPDKQSLVYTFAFPPQEHKIGRRGRRSGDREVATPSRSTTSAGRSRCGAASKRADEPLPRALIPPQPLPTRVQRDAVLRFAKARDALPGARRDPRAPPAARAARRHARGRGAQPRRQLPLRPGPARLGEDLERRADGDRAHAGRPARRRHGAQPQGDPQVPRGRRGGGGRGRASRSAG